MGRNLNYLKPIFEPYKQNYYAALKERLGIKLFWFDLYLTVFRKR